MITGRPFSMLGIPLLACATISLLGPGPTPSLAFSSGEKTLAHSVIPQSYEAWIIGGSGTPIPDQEYLDAAFGKYLALNGYGGYRPNALFTPEGLYPTTAIRDLPFATSVARGVAILNDTITQQMDSGNNIVVLGYSQSAAIASLEMRNLAALDPDAPSADQLAFVLLADPMNPNGGLLERFAGLTLPSVGLTFYGATPSDTIYPTDIYTMEYDGYADFPRYPLNLLASMNAFAGIYYLHGNYLDLPIEDIMPVADGGNAIELPVSSDYTGNTTYWMIPTENLPLLEPIRAIPGVGSAIAELIQPSLRVLINLGYGSITEGWDQGPADVATRFELFPANINPIDVLQALAAGTEEGINNFVREISSGISFPEPTLPAFDILETINSALADPAAAFTHVMNTFSSMASTLYSPLLPTADTFNAVLTSLPAYNFSLFMEGLEAGDLLAAIGNPIAADVGLLTMGAAFEYYVLLHMFEDLGADLANLFSF